MATVEEIFSFNLKRLRKAAKMGQKKLASLTQLTVGTISRFERGVQVPRSNNLKAVALALRCTPSEFFRNPETGAPGEMPSALLAEVREDISARIESELKRRPQQAGDLDSQVPSVGPRTVADMPIEEFKAAINQNLTKEEQELLVAWRARASRPTLRAIAICALVQHSERAQILEMYLPVGQVLQAQKEFAEIQAALSARKTIK